MAEDPQPRPLDAGTAFPGALDHAFIVESLDQQQGFMPDGSAGHTWTARVRCIHCGIHIYFDACGVPPCRPQGAQP